MLQQFREDAVHLQNIPHHTTRVHATTESDGELPVHRLQPSKLPLGYICMRCGAKNAHHVDQCYAKSLECRSCDKSGHITSVCRATATKSDDHKLTVIVHQATKSRCSAHHVDGSVEDCRGLGPTPMYRHMLCSSNTSHRHLFLIVHCLPVSYRCNTTNIGNLQLRRIHMAIISTLTRIQGRSV